MKFDILPSKRKKVNEKNRSLMKTSQVIARPKTPASLHSAKKMFSPHSESSLHRARPPSAQVTGLRKMVDEEAPKIKVIKRASTKETQGGGREKSAGFFTSGPSKPS